MPTIALDSQSAPSPRTSSASPSNFVYPPSLGADPTSAASVMSVVSQSISQPCHSAYNHTPTTTCRPVGFLPTPLEQYRLQLYNYAVHMDRLRCPQYNSGQQLLPTATTASAVAAFGYSNVAAAAAAAAASVRGVGGSSPYAPSSRLALSMSLFPQRIFQPEEPKPQHSYIGLIAMAILSSAETKLVLSDIYQYILDNYPYFRTRGPGWRNSIRHNLSLNDCFVKSGRSANGKGHYWAIHAANIEDFRKGDFRRRKAQRKVRKHMGLSVDDEGTDSPSPPPYAVTPPPTHHSHQNLTSTHAYFSYLHHQQQQHNPHNAQQFHAPYNHDQNCEQSLVAAAAAAVASGTEATAAHYINPVDVALPTAQKAYNNQLSIIKETTTTTASVIANLYSQTRKRQFDVASLLAPDVELNAVDDDSEAIERAATTTTTTTKRTLITKLSVQQHHHHPHHQRQLVQFTAQQQLQHNLSELDEQDIDVVTSDVEEDVEGECEEIDETIEEENELKEENNNCKNNFRTSLRRGPAPYSLTDQEPPEKHQQIQTPHKYVNTAETIAEPTKHFEYRNSNTIDRNIHQKSTAQQQQQHFHRIIHQLPHELNNVDPCIFGRYYGTYMAAAAAQQVVARHIRSSISFPLPITGTSPTLLMEPGIATQQAQSQQSQQQSHNQTKPSQQQKPLQQQ